MAGIRLAALFMPVVVVVLGMVSCTRTHSPLPNRAAIRLEQDEFSVMSYNLRLFGFTDRDGDNREDDFKPPREVRAVMDVVRSVSPDVLAIQEVGDAYSFELLKQSLASNGITFAYSAYLAGPSRHVNLATFSRFPIEEIVCHTNHRYSIQGHVLPVSRGYLETMIRPSSNYAFRLINVHLKSKRYHERGQTDMRRSEARILRGILQDRLRHDPGINLIIAGDFNDHLESAPIRAVLGEPDAEDSLLPLPLEDYLGDHWTYYWSAKQSYSRIDFHMVSRGMMKEFIPEKSQVIRHPRAMDASDHRPLVSVFIAAEKPGGPSAAGSSAEYEAVSAP